MKLFVPAIATLLLAASYASEERKDRPALRWEDVERVIEDPGSVVDRILEVYKPSVAEAKRVRIPESSPNPHTDLEVTLWKHDIPGLTILTTKTNKSLIKKREGKVLLSYLVVDVDTYAEYVKSSDGAVEPLLRMTPESARRRFPNVEVDTVDAKGTGILAQYLWEYEDAPMAFVHMSFVNGRLKAVSFGRDDKWVQQLIKTKPGKREKQESEQVVPPNGP